ncbi:hypothetical protein [Flavihumibacter profundi]|uniref:hypothetical protein n=1 Tax=Flavihumibacter profundi TaxID=2716883 RepID=UPI001CC7E5D6|nr:hypothetical protein [Flavihumibacter profundi]MBZ5856786.1 hypothetical protein [Flavihumibacter profundi]
MQTFRQLLISAISNIFLVWGTILIAMTWFLGRHTAGQIVMFYCLGGALVLLHFVVKFNRKEAAELQG